MWADPNLRDFESRVSRIERAHRKGYGFEAPGTLGRSATYRRERSLGRFLGKILIVVALGFLLKGMMLFQVGQEVYETRVADLGTGTGLDPLAARIMAADPATRLIAAFLGEVFPPR